jgi:hypothetical protein
MHLENTSVTLFIIKVLYKHFRPVIEEDGQPITIRFALKQIMHNGFVKEISELTRFYVLWRWIYGESEMLFDDANKLARSCNIDFEKEWNKSSFIIKNKDKIRILGLIAILNKSGASNKWKKTFNCFISMFFHLILFYNSQFSFC